MKKDNVKKAEEKLKQDQEKREFAGLLSGIIEGMQELKEAVNGLTEQVRIENEKRSDSTSGS
jgi:hypothetical protein